MYKWLTITGIVCLGFIVLLLGLGYLLKENEAATKVLIKKLDEEKTDRNKSHNPKEDSVKAVLTFTETNKDKIQNVNHFKKIIIENLTCINSEQCIVFNSHLTELNCYVAVNRIGASLLSKTLDKSRNKTQLKQVEHYRDKACYDEKINVTSVCKQNLCQLAEPIK